MNKLTHIHIPYGGSASNYAGRGGLPSTESYYFNLDENGCCPDENCPMGLYGNVAFTKDDFDIAIKFYDTNGQEIVDSVEFKNGVYSQVIDHIEVSIKNNSNYSVPSPRSTAGSPMTADLIAS